MEAKFELITAREERRRALREINRLPPLDTRRVVANIMETFERMGGLQKFAEWAAENPDKFYQLYGKQAPKELNLGIHLNEPEIRIIPNAPDRG